MYLSKLKLVNQDGTVLTDVKFHTGVNFVVDAENSSQHNKVGKTTFLKLIDIAMGAQDRKALYVDTSTNSINQELLAYIESERTSLNVQLADKFDNPSVIHALQVELYKKGRYQIDGEKISQQDYRKRLKEILFNSNDDKPTFRQLIKSFVRISMTGDNDTFLHNIPRSGSAVFRAVYNFLFDISDPQIDQKRGDLSKKLNFLKEGEKQFKQMQSVTDSSQVSQIIAQLNNEKDRIQDSLNDIIDLNEFEFHRDQWIRVRNQYQVLTNQLSELEYQLEQNQMMQEQVEVDAENDVDHDLTATFFDEVKTLLPDLNKDFEQLVDFNRQLFANKLDYLKTVRANIISDQKAVIQERIGLTRSNNTLLTLVSNDKLDEYNKLTAELANRNAEISQREQLLLQLQQYSDDIESLEKQIAQLEDEGSISEKVYNEKMGIFNRYFTEFAAKISREHPILTYVPDVNSFPLSITELSGTSTGTRKSLIAAYDLAYQCFAADENKSVPRFVVHDLIETIEGNNVRNTFEIANKNNIQYIVAVLKEKLDSSGFTLDEQKKYIVIQLSMTNRLFDEPN